MIGAIPLFPLCAFMACTGITCGEMECIRAIHVRLFIPALLLHAVGPRCMWHETPPLGLKTRLKVSATDPYTIRLHTPWQNAYRTVTAYERQLNKKYTTTVVLQLCVVFIRMILQYKQRESLSKLYRRQLSLYSMTFWGYIRNTYHGNNIWIEYETRYKLIKNEYEVFFWMITQKAVLNLKLF
jgi:hypothetical protein